MTGPVRWQQRVLQRVHGVLRLAGDADAQLVWADQHRGVLRDLRDRDDASQTMTRLVHRDTGQHWPSSSASATSRLDSSS